MESVNDKPVMFYSTGPYADCSYTECPLSCVTFFIDKLIVDLLNDVLCSKLLTLQKVIIAKKLASFKSSLLLKNYLQRTQTIQVN